MENEVLFGNLCIQENLCTGDEIEDAIKTQKELKRIGINKRLGEILIAKGRMSLPQLESIIKIQYKLFQTDEEAVLGQLAVNNDIITKKQLESAQNILRNKFKEDSSKSHSLLNVLVELGFADHSKITSLNKLYNQAFGKERQLAFCAHCQLIVENIKGQCGTCGKQLPPLSKRGDTKIFRLMPEPEVASSHEAITERMHAVSRSDESKVMSKVRVSKRMEARDGTQFRELPIGFSNQKKIWYAALILFVGISIGFLIRLKSDSRTAAEAITGNKINQNGNDASNDQTQLSLDDLLPFRDLVDTEKANILKALGFTPVSDGRWLPRSYVAEIQRWQKREGVEFTRLFPFELDNNRIYALVNKIDSNTYMLEFSDGSTKDFPAIEIIKQMQVFEKYQEIRKSRKSDESPEQFLQRLGDFCEKNDWFIEARNNYVLAFINNPENVELRKKLHFILPGEVGSELDSQIFQPELAEIPINPELPTVKLDIPLQKNLNVKFEPGMIDWKRIALPLTASDLISGDPWNADIERNRMNAGESMYLGYWIKSNVLDSWREKGKTFRKTNLESDVIVACEDFQINNEILNSARILYQLSKNFFNRDEDKFLGNNRISSWQNFEKSMMIFVVAKGADTTKYRWMESKYDLTFIEIDDFRRLENLIFPLLRVYFSVFIQKSSLKAITPWIYQGLESEFAFQFMRKNSIIFDQNFILGNALESWRRLSLEDMKNIDTVYKNATLSISKDVEQTCWGIARTLLASDLGADLFVPSSIPDKPTKTLLFVNEFKKIATDLHSSLTYNCELERKKLINTVKLNPGNINFLSVEVCEKMSKNNEGLLSSLKIRKDRMKYSALELWTLIGLSAYLDSLKFSTQAEKQTLKQELSIIFAEKPAFQKLIQDY